MHATLNHAADGQRRFAVILEMGDEARSELKAFADRAVRSRGDLNPLISLSVGRNVNPSFADSPPRMANFSVKATPKDYRFRSVFLVRSYSSIPDGKCHP
jgi:hypothetical protein